MKVINKIEKHNWFIRLIKFIIRKIRTAPQLIFSEEELPCEAIYIANHSGAAGPLTLSVYFPVVLVPWGAYPMTRNYISRWKYLYNVFYRQKLKYSKPKSFLLATLFGIISKLLYTGVSLIPTYPDIRLKHTINESIAHLDNHNSLLIFPEDSTNGYNQVVDSFHSGFVFLAEKYYSKRQVHIPIIPVLYNQEEQKIIIGKQYILPDFKKIKDRKTLADEFRKILNSLK